MKLKEIEKLRRARRIINFMQEGINPVSKEPIPSDSFLNDPQIIRTLSYISLVLSQDIQESLEENKSMNNNITSGNKKEGKNIRMGYENINRAIISNKINKFQSTDELKKLAEYMSRNELPKG